MPKILEFKINKIAFRIVHEYLEPYLLKGKDLPWKNTMEFVKYFGFQPYNFGYRVLRTSADFWSDNQAKRYEILYDCDYHGWEWRFFGVDLKTRNQDFKDIVYIGAARVEGFNKRSKHNYDITTKILPVLEKDIVIVDRPMVDSGSIKSPIIIPDNIK